MLKFCGKKKVKVERDGDGLILSITRNGYHWTSTYVDEDQLYMLRELINEFFEREYAPTKTNTRNQETGNARVTGTPNRKDEGARGGVE